MKKEFVLTEIRAAPDGTPYVYITLKSPDEVGGPQRPLHSNVSVAAFSSIEDMVKNLGPTLSHQMFGTAATVIKLGLNEYETLNIKVGDRIALDISKVHIGVS